MVEASWLHRKGTGIRGVYGLTERAWLMQALKRQRDEDFSLLWESC